MIIGLTYLLIRKIEFRRQLCIILKVKASFLTLVIENYTRLNSPLIIIINSKKTNKQILKHCFLKAVVSLNCGRNQKRFKMLENKPIFYLLGIHHSSWMCFSKTTCSGQTKETENCNLQLDLQGRKERRQGFTMILLTCFISQESECKRTQYSKAWETTHQLNLQFPHKESNDSTLLQSFTWFVS